MFADFGQFVLLIQNENFCVAARETDGEFVIIRKLAVHDVIGAGNRDFDRSVEVNKHCLWQMAPPVVQVFGGKNFADKKHFGNASELKFGEQVEIGDVDHDCGHPENEIDRLCRDKLDKLWGEHG